MFYYLSHIRHRSHFPFDLYPTNCKIGLLYSATYAADLRDETRRAKYLIVIVDSIATVIDNTEADESFEVVQQCPAID